MDRAQQGPLEAWSRFNPFNNLVRNIEMKSTDRIILILVASLALLLAGCGGGSSSTTAPPVDTGPSPADMAITDAKAALMNAESGLAGASTDAAMLAAYQAIQAAASDLINVLSENGGTAADRGSAIDALNDAAAEIGRLERAIAAAEKENAAAIAKLLKSLDDQTSVSLALNSPPVSQPGASPNGAVRPGQGPGTASAPDFDAVYGGTTTVTVNATGAAANAKLKDAVGTMVAGKNGWSGTMVTARDPATKNTDTVVVYSNIEAPKSVAFSKAYPLTSGSRPIGNTSGDSNVQASEFSTGNAPFAHGTNDDTNVQEVIRISGTYAGASGVYRCIETTGAGCTSQGTVDGIQLAGGTWQFEPSPGAMAMQTDSNYSYFGWWLRENPDGSYKPSVFYGHNTRHGLGETLYFPPSPGFHTGTATYSGPAVGKFAIAGFPNTGGHFTADASLSVDFEANNSGDNVAGIEGAVTNFMVGGADVPWRVDFGSTHVTRTGGFSGGSATWTIDGVASLSPPINPSTGQFQSGTNVGTYRGVFQLNNEFNDRVPMTITGAWGVPYVAANNTEAIGHMIGAFGVTRDD